MRITTAVLMQVHMGDGICHQTIVDLRGVVDVELGSLGISRENAPGGYASR